MPMSDHDEIRRLNQIVESLRDQLDEARAALTDARRDLNEVMPRLRKENERLRELRASVLSFLTTQWLDTSTDPPSLKVIIQIEDADRFRAAIRAADPVHEDEP